MQRPTVFVGSSTEQLATARQVKVCLSAVADVVVWDEAAFEINESVFEGLLKAADRFDFSVFVFNADDVARIRTSDAKIVRDNVLFEFGLFTGRMGRGRTFWVSARDSTPTHLPTDLAGIVHLSFEQPKDLGGLPHALERVCARLQQEIEKHGQRTDRSLEVLESVRILCAATLQYSQPKFAADIERIQKNFPDGSITAHHGVKADQLFNYLSDQHWDILHLAMYVDPVNGDLLVPGEAKQQAMERMPVAGVAGLATSSGARLVVIVTCDSLALAAQVARQVTTIAGHRSIDVGAALNWSGVFYKYLAQGCPVSEAFNRAQALTDPGLVLLMKHDFRLNLPARKPIETAPV